MNHISLQFQEPMTENRGRCQILIKSDSIYWLAQDRQVSKGDFKGEKGGSGENLIRFLLQLIGESQVRVRG